jgi:hypothetical protein
MTNNQQKLDGNAAGGILGQIFAFEMTTAHVICASCDSEWTMGVTAVYATAMGTIVRCPGCDATLIRVANGPQRYWLDFSGLRLMQLQDAE